MRLFHVSEESNIDIFIPRKPERDDLDQSVGLVWALDEKHLPNFLTPRNCPRVTYRIGENTSKQDREAYFSSSDLQHVVIIENDWFKIMKETQLILYEFSPEGFELQDSIAGYYVSKSVQTPIAKYIINDLFGALFERNIELRVVGNLWDIAEKIKSTTLDWSICRMGYAKPKL